MFPQRFGRSAQRVNRFDEFPIAAGASAIVQQSQKENTHLNALDRGLPARATRNNLGKPAIVVPRLAPRSNTAEVLKIMRESPRESPEHPKSEITGHGKSTFSNAAYRFSLRLWDPTAFLKTLIDKPHWQNLQLLGII